MTQPGILDAGIWVPFIEKLHLKTLVLDIQLAS